MKLLIITPFKNEARSIEKTLQSICKQSVQPVKWILVDDNSADEGPAIVKQYASQFSFIHYTCRVAQAGRATGANIVAVFNYGLQVAADNKIEWDVVLKLDADLVIDHDNYIEFILSKFHEHFRLGIASGATYTLKNGIKEVESKHKWHTQGPNKFYRKECLQAIGGLKPFKGWDGIDDIIARHNGYITEKFFEQPIHHLYPTQTRAAEGGATKGLIREANGYQNRDYPLYMFLLKSIKLFKSKGIYSGLYFLFYGIIIKVSKRPLVNKQESKIIRKFLFERFTGRLKFSQVP